MDPFEQEYEQVRSYLESQDTVPHAQLEHLDSMRDLYRMACDELADAHMQMPDY